VPRFAAAVVTECRAEQDQAAPAALLHREERVRGIVGLILAGLGAFFIVLSILLRFYVPGQLVKFPLDEYQIASLHADNARYFSAAELRELTGVSVTATNTLRGDVAASNSGTAVWDQFIAVRDDTNKVNFNYIQLRGPFDRRSGLLSNCCGANLSNGSVHLPSHVHLSGQGFVWPFSTPKKTYMLFDNTLGRAVPASYAGTATVGGLQTYRFVEHVSPTQAGTQTLPGNLVGMKDQPSVTLPEFYQTTTTYWVDPVTGGPVKVEQNENLTLRDDSGVTRLTLFQADLKFTQASVNSFVANDRKNHNKITLISSVLPLILLLAGLVLLAVGIVLSVLDRGRAREAVDEERYEPQDQGLTPH
jgi:Porin PorA